MWIIVKDKLKSNKTRGYIYTHRYVGWNPKTRKWVRLDKDYIDYIVFESEQEAQAEMDTLLPDNGISVKKVVRNPITLYWNFIQPSG